MLSLHVFCRALRSRVIWQAASAAFVPDFTSLHFYSFSHKISTSCSTNARIDEGIFYAKGEKQTRSNVSNRGTSVFSAGSFRERGIGQKNEVSLPRERWASNLLLPTEPQGCDGWSKLKEQSSYKGSFEDCVMAQMIHMDTDYKIAKSFLSFVAEKNGDISYRVLLKYLVLCVKQNQSQEVCDLYDIMKMKFRAYDTFDYGASSLFIRGFSKTSRWRESISILEAMKKVESVSARNYGDCIKAAIEHHEPALVWTLYDEMIQKNLLLPEDATQCLFNASQDLQNDGYRKKLLNILSYFRGNQIYPQEALMKSIKCWFESIPNESWRGTLTQINDRGHCLSCKQQIESIQLTPDEYSVLRKAVIDSIIEGEDVFRKTTPQELQEFLQFVGSRRPYDFVVDGLNVAYHSNKAISSLPLLNVVSCLAARGKRVLVLGRKHMLVPSKKWRKQDIRHLQTIADCFFLDNISLDDPFLLYASLNSGSHCCFLTRDLLRDHKACLPDAETRRLFFKWQRGHQLVLSTVFPGNITLQDVLSYDTVLQCTDTSYHIPYDETDVARASYEVPRAWLCLKQSQ